MTVIYSTSPQTRKRNELLSRKRNAENELRHVEAELWRMDNNLPPRGDAPQNDMPPLPSMEFGVICFALDVLQWILYIAMKLGGYALGIWLVYILGKTKGWW